ncbi:unnamed protein product [Rotaria sordida]|uniref:Helix-turn-helix domain-containing protein n=1 Tax=Rotaria sordida TaxID=392033 RepID=A0A814GU12_9BILA|nr:unnamed protein product [Rotaria sordida]
MEKILNALKYRRKRRELCKPNVRITLVSNETENDVCNSDEEEFDENHDGTDNIDIAGECEDYFDTCSAEQNKSSSKYYLETHDTHEIDLYPFNHNEQINAALIVFNVATEIKNVIRQNINLIDWYREENCQIISDIVKVYECLHQNGPLPKLIERTNKYLLNLRLTNWITQKQYEQYSMKPNEVELTHLYKSGTPLRSIVSGLKHPTMKISKSLDKLFQPLFDKMAHQIQLVHPIHMKKNIPFAMLIRAIEYYSTFEIYSNEREKLGMALLLNKYPDKFYRETMQSKQQKRLKKLKFEVTECQSGIKNVVSFSTFIEIESHIKKLILKEKEIINERHNKKFTALKIPVNQGEFNNKLVYNLSYRALSSAEESL